MTTQKLYMVRRLSDGQVFEVGAVTQVVPLPQGAAPGVPAKVRLDVGGTVSGTWWDCEDRTHDLAEVLRPLSQVRPGERVLVPRPASEPKDAAWWPCEVRPGELGADGVVIEDGNGQTYSFTVGGEVQMQDGDGCTDVYAGIRCRVQIGSEVRYCGAALSDGRIVMLPSVVLPSEGGRMLTARLGDALDVVPPAVLDEAVRQFEARQAGGEAEPPPVVRGLTGWLWLATHPNPAAVCESDDAGPQPWEVLGRLDADGALLVLSSERNPPVLDEGWRVLAAKVMDGAFLVHAPDLSIAVHRCLPDGRVCLGILD